MITTWSRGDADLGMPEEVLVRLGGVVRRHPWWRARANLTCQLLRRLHVSPAAHVLDVGCGWGVTLEALERRGHRVDGLDVSREALELLDRPDRRLIEADLTRPLPESVPRYDAVLALDVIEHLDDDRAAVARLGRLVRPDGVVLISVPARPDLFSDFDRVQGHRRRYEAADLRAAIEEGGLRLERLLWWGAWMVPLVRWQRRRPRSGPNTDHFATYASYLRLPPWPGPWLMRLAFQLEQGPTLRGWPTTGTSLFAITRP